VKETEEATMGITTFAQTMTDDEVVELQVCGGPGAEIVNHGISRKRVCLEEPSQQGHTPPSEPYLDEAIAQLDKEGEKGTEWAESTYIMLIKEQSLDALQRDAFPAPAESNAFCIMMRCDASEEIGGTQTEMYWIVEFYVASIVKGVDMIEEYDARYLIAGRDPADEDADAFSKDLSHLTRRHGPYVMPDASGKSGAKMRTKLKVAYYEKLRTGHFVPLIDKETTLYAGLPSALDVYTQVGDADPSDGASVLYLDKASEAVVYTIKRALLNKNIDHKPYEHHDDSTSEEALWQCFGRYRTESDVCYGPGNIIFSHDVCRLDRALQQIDDSDFLAAFTPDTDDWPAVLGALSCDRNDKDYIFYHWQHMKVFVRGAAVRAQNIVVHFW